MIGVDHSDGGDEFISSGSSALEMEVPSRPRPSTKWRLTLEPVAFCYAYVVILQSPILQQYIFRSTLYHHGVPYDPRNLETSPCSQESSNSTYNMGRRRIYKEAQQTAAIISIVSTLSSSIPSLFTALLLGSLSDKVGRKITFGVPVVGCILETIGILTVVTLDLPFTVLFIGAALSGLCGHSTAVVMGIFSYVSDITLPEKRSRMLGILEAVALIGGTMGHLTSGILLELFSFQAVYVVILAIETCTLVYILLFLRESHLTRQRITSWRLELLPTHLVSRMTDVVMRVTHRYRLQFVFLASSSGILLCCLVGFQNVIVLFVLDKPLCLTSFQVGLFLAENSLAQAVGALLAFIVLRRCVSEWSLLFFGIGSLVIAVLFMSIARHYIVVFIVPVIGMLGGVSLPSVRAKISLMVDQDEQGALFASVATLETLCTLLGALFFSSLYALLVKCDLKELCFVGVAAVLSCSFILLRKVRRYERRANDETAPVIRMEETDRRDYEER